MHLLKKFTNIQDQNEIELNFVALVQLFATSMLFPGMPLLFLNGMIISLKKLKGTIVGGRAHWSVSIFSAQKLLSGLVREYPSTAEIDKNVLIFQYPGILALRL